MRFKVDANHGAELEIDKEQQDVFQLGIAFLHHMKVLIDCRPYHRRTDNENCKKMKHVGNGVTKPLDSIGFYLRACYFHVDHLRQAMFWLYFWSSSG